MKKKVWQLVLPLVLVIVTLIIYAIATRDKEKESEIVRVERGIFEIIVTGMGELEALEFTQIMIPDVLSDRSVRRIHGLSITDIVREGTVVKKGDYVATLDPSDVEEQLRSSQDRLEVHLNTLENAKIDSSLNLSAARDEIRQARDLVLDREIRVEQSVYESGAVQRQAQINLETSQRSLEQRMRNYTQIRRRHVLNIQRRKDNVDNQEEEIRVLEQLKRDLRVTAPGDGLVVYARGRDNQKIRVGSFVGRWAPLIATLPDLSTLQSVVFIKEIDIAKVSEGLPVRIRIDAFPEEQFAGVITRVANVGQEMPGEFFNAFKVEITVDPKGKQLLPGMTSVNNIVVESIRESVLVSRLAVFNDEELGQYVYKREGLNTVKQQIQTSGENDLFYRVQEGLKSGDRVLLTPPEKADNLRIVSL